MRNNDNTNYSKFINTIFIVDADAQTLKSELVQTFKTILFDFEKAKQELR